MHEEGFEPSHLTIVGLKSTALDHSAIRASKSTWLKCRTKLVTGFSPVKGEFKRRVL